MTTNPIELFRLRRVGGVARVSGMTMIVLGGLSLVLTLVNPLSGEFAVSLAILILGVIEWRLGGRMRKGQPGAAPRLAWNQVAVAVVVTLYSAWRIWATTDESIRALLDRPEIGSALDALDPMIRAELAGRLPGVIRFAYLLVIPVVWLGCGGMVTYYLWKGRVNTVGPAERDR